MERLTYKAPDSEMVWFKDKGRLFEPCEMSAHQSRLAIAKLAAYEQAEEQGLLLRLPCKVGSNIYRITDDGVDTAECREIRVADFKRYVDRYCVKHLISVAEALQHYLVQMAGRQYKEQAETTIRKE